jgi:GlpG protein
VPGLGDRLDNAFGFFSVQTLSLVDHGAGPSAALGDIHRGEVWRLFTPILLHIGWMHLIFNMTAVWYEGTVIEYCRGTRTLAVLGVVSAVTSNVGEYLYQIYFTRGLHLWFGISGVGYAMFGYIWTKSLVQPEHGIRIDPRSIRPMLLWLLLGFVGFPFANGAHVVGLVVGILFGLARF